MKKYNPNAKDVKGGPGGYVRVNLPGFGDCWATLTAFDYPEFRSVQASVLGWHRGNNILFWQHIHESDRKALWSTLDDAERAVAVKVLGCDPFPRAA